MKQTLTHSIQTAKAKAQSAIATLSLTLAGLASSTVFAEDPFAKTGKLAKSGISKVQGIGVVTLGLAVVITGLVYGFGGRETKAAIKKHWLAIAIAIIAVSAGPSIVEWGFKFVKG